MLLVLVTLRKGGGCPGRRQVLTEQQHAFCSAYIRLGNASGACWRSIG